MTKLRFLCHGGGDMDSTISCLHGRIYECMWQVAQLLFPQTIHQSTLELLSAMKTNFVARQKIRVTKSSSQLDMSSGKVWSICTRKLWNHLVDNGTSVEVSPLTLEKNSQDLSMSCPWKFPSLVILGSCKGIPSECAKIQAWTFLAGDAKRKVQAWRGCEYLDTTSLDLNPKARRCSWKCAKYNMLLVPPPSRTKLSYLIWKCEGVSEKLAPRCNLWAFRYTCTHLFTIFVIYRMHLSYLLPSTCKCKNLLSQATHCSCMRFLPVQALASLRRFVSLSPLSILLCFKTTRLMIFVEN